MTVLANHAISFRPVDVAADAAMLHAWVTDPKAEFWMMQDADVAAVAEEYAGIEATDGHDAFIGSVDGVASFLVERYDPARSELAEHGTFGPGDVGMHVLVAPTDTPVQGFTRAVFSSVMTFCFSSPHVERVVVEPDARNAAILRLNADAGFQIERLIALRAKTAALSTCTRSQWERSRLGGQVAEGEQ